MKNITSLALILCLCGCSHSGSNSTPPTTTVDDNAARNAQIIRIATTQAVSLGLNVYANEGHRVDALMIAQKIQDIVSSSALPYLNGTSGATSAAVNGFLNGQFVGLPDEAQSFISLAAMILDSYLPAPSATAVLDANQLLYIKAFFNGLNDGAAQFSANPPAERAVPMARAVRARSTASWFNTAK